MEVFIDVVEDHASEKFHVHQQVDETMGGEGILPCLLSNGLKDNLEKDCYHCVFGGFNDFAGMWKNRDLFLEHALYVKLQSFQRR